MKLYRTLLTAAFLGLLAGNNADAATAGVQDIEAEDLAKIARVRAQKNAMSGRNSQRKDKNSDSEECGSIDIGNSTGSGRRGGKTDITVFIDGDVINAFNKCR